MSTTNTAGKPRQVKVESWGRLVWHRFYSNRLAIVGMVILAGVMILSVFSPWLASYDPGYIDLSATLNGKPAPPSFAHPFGTDSLGRDYLSRIMSGGQVSLAVGFISVFISIAIGVPLGAIMGYFGGKLDFIFSRLIELLQSVPYLLLILVVNVLLPPSMINIILVMGFFGWMDIARQVRAQVLSLRNQDFVLAAVSLGLRKKRVIFRHILPNALMPVIVQASLAIGGNILTESALSYLGFGVQEPLASWGNMLKSASLSFTALVQYPWLTIFPGIFITLTVLALNFVGEGLRDALDARTDNG
jgi:peptide/nickel transport system permease protein